MHIRKITLNNWMVYRGEQTIILDAKSYSVVARRASNSEASNWAGKSSFLESIYFALTGKLNPDRHSTADGWISDGEKSGFVQLELDTGEVIRRERKKSTQLYFENAKGDEAQMLLETRLGLRTEDAVNTYYFQQKKMARMILAAAQERMDIVSSWLDLAPLEQAESLIQRRLSGLIVQLQNLNQSIVMVENNIANNLGDANRLSLEAEIETLNDEYGKVSLQMHAARKEIDDNATSVAATSTIEQYENLVSRSWDVKNKIGSFLDPHELETSLKKSDEKLQTAHTNFDQANRAVATQRILARGEFDGKCPVAGIQCPATDTINASSKENAARYQGALTQREAEETALNFWTKESKALHQKYDDYKNLVRTFELYRVQVEDMQSAYDAAMQTEEPKDSSALRERHASLTETVYALRSRIERLTTAKKNISEFEKSLEGFRAKKIVLEKQIATTREAHVIFGKQGAQRRVAESAIAQIESGANALMQDCGINLTVEVCWSREGQGLAKVCDACGNPFPSSARIKVCDRCGAARGPLLINKLDVILSDQSGGAEDLVGAAFQLSASAWLRTKRESRWSTALIDEPFGSLDVANRRAFASHLTAMLRGRYGFEQAFVVSHSPDTVDMLPGRIQVISDGKFSKIEVLV